MRRAIRTRVDGHDLFLSQNRPPVLLARVGLITVPPLDNHIRTVLRWRPDRQMSWVHTWRVVAHVHHIKPIRDNPPMNLV